jgi:hypothetical protein
MRGGARRGRGRARCGGGRSATGLTLGAQPGWGSSQEWLDAVTSAVSVRGSRTQFTSIGSEASTGGVRCEAVAGVGAMSRCGPRNGSPGASPAMAVEVIIILSYSNGPTAGMSSVLLFFRVACVQVCLSLAVLVF